MKQSFSLALALASAALLSACVVVPAHHRYRETGYAVAPEVVVDVPPPAPRVEMVPVAPYPGAIWIGGYWGWSAGRHAWVPGHYERPRPGYRYEPQRWENRGGHWHLRVGGWVRF